MSKALAVVAGTVAVLALALPLTDRAEAGASASAPSKKPRASQVVASQGQSRAADKNGFAITEYSSSSAWRRSHWH